MAGTFKPQMKPAHEQAFTAAARLYNVYILVRRTNLASLDHIGDPNCVPKRLDCKAKTADRNFSHPSYGPKKTAGLVVDPNIVGPQAFNTAGKYQTACDEWRNFAPLIDPGVSTWERQQKLTYIPNGRFYLVDLDPRSERYGCVKFSLGSNLPAAKYIHGDFDLYGIVRADDPARNVAVQEKMFEQKHSRSPEFFDVQHFINRKLGVAMVQHGAQEAYGSEHSNEGIDIFHPDGNITGAENAAEIMQLYQTRFMGRQLFTRNGARLMVRGLFTTPG